MPPEVQSAASPASAVDIGAPVPRREHTYTEILKSTVLIGGSSVLTLAIGVVRTKAMSILLGPTGFGLMGIYGSIADLARSFSELGINASGVRQIAAATSSGLPCSSRHVSARTVGTAPDVRLSSAGCGRTRRCTISFRSRARR